VTGITPSERSSLINGLHKLADFLERSGPAPRSAEAVLIPTVRAGTEEHIVVLIEAGTVSQIGAQGATSVTRNFGPITYKVTLALRTGLAGKGGE